MEGHTADRTGLLLYKSGTVCNDEFDDNAANAICSLMGYAAIGSEWSSGSKWGIQDTYGIALDDVECSTRSWSSCTYSEHHDCSHYEDVFLTCSEAGSGRVSILCTCYTLNSIPNAICPPRTIAQN